MKNMAPQKLTAEQITAYGCRLHAEERSPTTVEKYLHDVRTFAHWLDGKAVTRELAVEWKSHLLHGGYASSTINFKLAALNGLFRYMGWEECQVNFLKIQCRLSEIRPAS